MAGRRGFFAVDRDKWAGVCSESVNAAVAYLVLCRGTGGDNTTTAWSVNAIERYTSISRSRANKAIERLIEIGHISKTRSGSRPQYKVRKGKTRRNLPSDATIWLPNEIVTGTDAGETPPIERLRQTGCVMTLRLFVDLYGDQNLLEDGGISRDTYFTYFTKESVDEYAQYQLCLFSEEHETVCWNNTTLPHHRRHEDLTDEEKESGKNPGVDFFSRFETLKALGLVQCVPYLVESDSPEAEIVHSLGDHETLEREIREAAESAALSMYARIHGDSDRRRVSNGNLFVPIPKHQERVQVFGVWRLRYRAQTSMTTAWWKSFNEKGRRYLEQYRQMAADTGCTTYQGKLATSR